MKLFRFLSHSESGGKGNASGEVWEYLNFFFFLFCIDFFVSIENYILIFCIESIRVFGFLNRFKKSKKYSQRKWGKTYPSMSLKSRLTFHHLLHPIPLRHYHHYKASTAQQEMSVTVQKRGGEHQPFDEVKLRKRVEHFTYGLDLKFVVVRDLVDNVMDGSKEVMASEKIDELLAESAAYKATRHPDYALLAGRLAVSALHKTTKSDFFEAFTDLYTFINPKNGDKSPLVSDEAYEAAKEHKDRIQAAINYTRDFNYEYFGYKTLERSYLLRLEKDGKRYISERPQHMLMRVAIGVHFKNIEKVIETYDLLSEGWFTHATPTLFNAGTPNPQMSSCFLVAMKSDSIEGIYDTLKTCALISKTAGGIGLHVHNIRANGMHLERRADIALLFYVCVESVLL